MVSRVFIMAAVIAYVEGRFGQEQVPIAAISAVQGGDAGAAATIAGAAISDLLGAANSCDKLTRADQIFTELGGGADALAAAIGMVTAEKNTNPFANGNVQNVCGDASLPVTPELRGITPLIDPDVDVNGDVAALSQSSAANPLAADGMSVFDLLDAAGLGDLVASQNSAGGAAAGGAGAAAGGNQANNGNQQANNGNQADNGNQANNGNQQANNGNQQANNGNQASNGNANQQDDAAEEDADCNDEDQAANDNNGNNNNNNAGNNNSSNNGAAGNATENAADNANNNQQANNGNAGNNNAGNNAGNDNNNAGNNAGNNAATGGAAAGSLAGADFGLCTPTITFQGGENGRPADEFTFQIADPLARGGQGEALNPDIITNALCNQLTNVCEANDAAVAACESAKAAVQGGARDKSTADTFNTLVGFEGAVTNPDGGAEDVPAAAGAKRTMRRGLRA